MPLDPWEDEPVQVAAPTPARDPWEGSPQPEQGDSRAALPPATRLDPWESPEAAPARAVPPEMSLDWGTPAASSEVLAARNAQFAREFHLPEGPSPNAFWHSVAQPIIDLAHELTPDELAEGWDAAKVILSQKPGDTWEDIEQRLAARPVAKPTRTQKALAGLQQAAARAVNFFASPVGAATLGISALPALAQKAISAIFVTQMITSLPEDVQTLAEGFYDDDPEKLARGAAGLGLNTTFIAQGLKHGMADTAGQPAAVRSFREPNERVILTEPLVSEFGGLPQNTPTPEPAPVAAAAPPAKLTVNVNPPEAQNQPLSTIEQKYLADDIRARRPISATVAARAGTALPEGYTLAGDHYTFEEPAAPESDAQRLAREQREAMASLRASKAAEPAPADPSDQSAPSEAPAARDPWEEAPVPNELGDRPPDILDTLESNYPSGVRVPQMPDYDEPFSQARGAAKAMLRRTSGEPLDQVLQELHNQGMYRRITSEGELLDAITSAAESRISHAEQSKAARNAIDEWLDKAIDATAPYSGDPFEGVTGAPVWLTKSLAHGALLTVREALRLGRTVKRALQEGLNWIKEQNPKDFHEGEARLWLSQAESREWLKNLRPEPPLDNPAPAAIVKHEAPQRDLQRRQQPGNPGGRDLRPAREQALQPAAPGSPEHASELQRAAAAAQANDLALRTYLAQLPRRENGLLDWRKMSDAQASRVFKLESDRLDALQEHRQIGARSTITYPPHSEFMGRVQTAPDHPSERIRFRETAQAPSLESWADRTIAEGQKRLNTGLDPELLAAYAVKGSAILARGAHDFASWSAAMLSEFGESIRPHLSALWDSIRQRAFSLQTSAEISDRVKAGIAQDLFHDKRTHAELSQAAATLLQQQGPEAAFQIFADPQSGLAMDGRNALGAALERHYRTAETVARAAGDVAAANAAADQQIKLWQTDAYGTELAQGLNSRKLYDDASPTAKLRQAQQVFEQSAGTTFETIKPQVDLVAGAIRQGHIDAAEQIRIDPATNDAARAAVDEAILNSPETHKAIVMELAEPFASSPSILADARVQVRAKADELLNKSPRPPGLTAPQHLRAILDDLAQRAATIASAHYQGAEPGITLRDKLQQRLGLDQPAATRLAAGMDTAFQAMVKKAAAKLSQRVATARARLAGTLTADATDFAVDRAIREQLRKHNLELGKLLEHATSETVRDTQKTIGDRIVEASGLTGPAADQLRATFDRRWNALSDAAKRSRLNALAKAAGTKPLPPKLRSVTADLIRLTRLGALDDAAFHDLVKKRLKLPAMSPEIARELVRRANDLEKMPAGFLRDRASTQLLNWVYMKAGVKWVDIPMGMFYSNVLSGLTTAVKIPFENTGLLVSQTVLGLLRGRINPLRAVQAFGRGTVKGGLQAAEIMKTGIVTGITTGVREGEHPSSVMELKPFGQKGDIINYWKWFSREIAALHVSTFKPAWEIKQSMVAQSVARSEGLRGQAAQARAAELLANTPDRIAAAQAKASAELAALGNQSKLDYRRRVLEILEQERERTMPGSTALARDFALRTTYLNKPYGFLGFIAEHVRTGIEQARVQFPILGRGVKSQLPFTTVVANILNEKLNWTPQGAFRAALALRSGELYGRPIMERGEVGDLLAKSILGTIMLGALGTLAGTYIHGSGPSSPSQRKQLQGTGWIPNSIGPINGRYYSWVNTPGAAGLAWIGNWNDWHRYAKGDAADGEARAVYALRGMGDVIVSQGMLDGLKRVLEGFGNSNKAEGGDAIERALARTAGAFLVPNLISQIDKSFDPTVYDSTGMKAALLSQVPFLRRDNRPALNALGEPLQQGPFGQWTKAQTSDRLWRAIAAQQAWIPEVPKDVIVGRKADGPDQFRILTPDERYLYIRAAAPEIRATLDPYTILSLDPAAARHYVQTTVEKIRAAHKPRF